MVLTVKDAVNLEHTRDFVLLTGKADLERRVDALGIIEHEMKEDVFSTFRKGDFVITNFYSIKDKPEEIFEIVKALIEINVSALAVKKLYFDEIDEKTIKYADENKFPIFIYDKSILSEEIIFDILKALKNEDDSNYMASKIYGIVGSRLSPNMVRKIAYEINGSFKENIKVSYIINHSDMDHIISSINSGPYRDVASKGLIFEGGILIINSFEESKFNLESFFLRNGIIKENCLIGESSDGFTLSQLDFGIKEAIFSAQMGALKDRKKTKFDELGIYKFLLPNIENEWLKKFYAEFVDKIKEYDKKYEANLLITGKNFVKFNGDYKKTAEHMYQHHNTIRYRISKIREIAYVESEISGFYEQLAIALRIDDIIHDVKIPKNIL